MKAKTGRCLLPELLTERQLTVTAFADQLQAKPALLHDYIEGRRVMPLRNAKAIAQVLDCRIEDLYEWLPEASSTRQ